MSDNQELSEILKQLFEQQQKQMELLARLLPKPVPNPVEQESLPPKNSDEEELLLPDEDSLNEESEGGASLLNEEQSEVVENSSFVDVGEELVEETLPEPEPTFVKPISRASNVLAEEEVLEDGAGGKRGNRACVRVAFSTGPRKNKFKDNSAFAKRDTFEFDKKVRTQDALRAHKMIEKRPPSTKIVVSCLSCQRRFRIDPKLAPQRIGDNLSSYQCDSCILSRKG